jgi:beta-lactamase superfamily II metal-dependent hydrolase
LTHAANEAELMGIDLKTVNFIQIPHHGSRRNIGPTILNRIVGPILNPHALIKTGFVSAAKEGAPKHPSKKVTNAFYRRGVDVHGTQGQHKRHHHEMGAREGWSRSEPIPFHMRVEESE